MSITAAFNSALRQVQLLPRVLQNFSLNKRFLNLNIFIGAMLLILFLQTYWFKSSRAANETLVLLKSDKYHSVYNSILSKYNTDDFRARPMGAKCDMFFHELNSLRPDWKLDDFDTTGHDDNYIDFEEFIAFKQSVEPNLRLTEKKITELQTEFNEVSHFSVEVDQKINDALGSLRVFGQCYINDNEGSNSGVSFATNIFSDNGEPGSNSRANPSHCRDIEARIFPWLSNMFPIFTRWDGTTVRNLPKLAGIGDEEYVEYSFINGLSPKKAKRDNNDPNCFLTAFKEGMNGRGYVISASDSQFDELMRLALVLRAIGNTLPIQIMHKGDLSDANREKLIKQFRRPIHQSELPASAQGLTYGPQMSFPEQEVWFVNVRPAIKEGFGQYFQKYANKLLAYMFNSFEEMILIDTDTVPFLKLQEIMKLPGYTETGAFFFQDRQLRGQNTENQVNYFKRLMPSKLDHYFFDVPLATDYTLKNRFIGERRNHFMESGVVVINRARHFVGMLAAIQLNFWSTTTNKIHGDKELFWLGLSVAGDEEYTFNKLGAASIGDLTPSDNRRFPNSNAQELCSNHPGHISGYDNKTLMWINSGFTFCKHGNAAEFDAGKPLFAGMSQPELQRYYSEKTLIRAAIVPPPQEVPGSSDGQNPDSGWSDEHKYCMSYTWCAVDFVGNNEREEERGLLVRFDSDQTKWFDFIGDLWMDGIPEA